MPTVTGALILILVLAGLVGAGIYVRVRTRKHLGIDGASEKQADALRVACEELDEETRQLAVLLEKLEAEFDEDGPSDGQSLEAPVDDTTVVDLEGVASIAEEVALSIEQRRAQLQAALEEESGSADWEQDSPEVVSLIEALQDIPAPASAGAIEPDDLKQIRGIGKVFEGVLNEKGIFTFQQLASLTLEDIETLSKELKNFGSRVRRDRWIEQARELAELQR